MLENVLGSKDLTCQAAVWECSCPRGEGDTKTSELLLQPALMDTARVVPMPCKASAQAGGTSSFICYPQSYQPI